MKNLFLATLLAFGCGQGLEATEKKELSEEEKKAVVYKVVGTISAVALGFSCLFFYNSRQQNKINKIAEAFEKKAYKQKAILDRYREVADPERVASIFGRQLDRIDFEVKNFGRVIRLSLSVSQAEKSLAQLQDKFQESLKAKVEWLTKEVSFPELHKLAKEADRLKSEVVNKSPERQVLRDGVYKSRHDVFYKEAEQRHEILAQEVLSLSGLKGDELKARLSLT